MFSTKIEVTLLWSERAIFIESFNEKFRDDSLNQNWFVDLKQAREVIEAWRVATTRCGRTTRWGILRPTNLRRPDFRLTWEVRPRSGLAVHILGELR